MSSRSAKLHSHGGVRPGEARDATDIEHLLDDASDGVGDGATADPGFIDLVGVLLAQPPARLPFAVGANGATPADSTLFWTYSPHSGLHLEARAGFLATATGNGGFVLDVERDGEWRLRFSDSHTRIGSEPDERATPLQPPAGNVVVGIANGPKVTYDGSAGHQTIDGTLAAPGVAHPQPGNDTIFGGVGDWLIGGTRPHFVAPNGNTGNCAIYTAAAKSDVPAGSVLVDMQNGRGYGSNAEGNVFVNIDQVRGSSAPNVLIGAAAGSDLKSGGGHSVLVSTGGTDYELRPDGDGNVLVSTTGSDRILFDPSKGWKPGMRTTELGFRDGNSAWLDLRLLGSNIHDPAAAGYDPATGMADINDYVRLVETPSGESVMFRPAGALSVTWIDLVDLGQTHGLTASGLLAQHGLVI